ncbi:MAG: ABC transporter permease [Anaerolineales bacterium]|jgi:putative ABC transport system permease protein
MILHEVLRVAWKSITSNRMRSLLTMLGIIIGVAAVIIMVAVSAGTEATIAESINSLGANLIFVNASMGRLSPGGQSGRGGLVFDDAEAIAEEIRGIAGVAVEQTSVQSVRAGNITLEEIQVLGTTPDFPSVRDVPLASGRFVSQNDVDRRAKIAVLGYSLAHDLFGDADPIGETITVGTTKMTVVGVMAEKGIIADLDYDARLYTPITVVFQRFMPSTMARVVGDRVRSIYVEAENHDDIEDIILQIELLLARRHNLKLDELDFTVLTQQDIISTREATTEAFRTLLGWVAGVSLIVGGIGIMNIMLVSVMERTREVGLRQAVGARPGDIRLQFLSEALLLSLIGGLLGVVFGIVGAWLFGELSDMRTVLVPASVLLAFASAAGVGIFFGYYPANQAAQLDPIEALRYE